MYEFIFYFCALAVVYTYAGYPALIALWARLSPRPVHAHSTCPTVVIVVVAHNEEARIAAKLRSCLAQDYPADRFRVLIALDGSDDGTHDIVKSFGDLRVSVVAFPKRRGKAACLNDAVTACQEDVLVFTDARQALNAQAVRCLVENLADTTVGAVSGELVFMRDDMNSFAESVDTYWRYEKFIRRCESLVHSVPGVTGALYAIRRACFRPIPAGTILDDVAIPMQAVRAGYRVVFDSRAIAYDKASQSPAQEKLRKVRTLAGNYQVVFAFPWLLVPVVNPIFLQFVSHKVMRLVAPFALLALLASNVALARTSTFFSAVLFAQLLGYAAGLAAITSPAVGRWRIARLASIFILLNWYAILGLKRFLADREAHLWNTHKSESSGGAP